MCDHFNYVSGVTPHNVGPFSQPSLFYKVGLAAKNKKRQQKLNYVHTLNISSSRSNRSQGAYYWWELAYQTSASRKDNLTRNAQRH